MEKEVQTPGEKFAQRRNGENTQRSAQENGENSQPRALDLTISKDETADPALRESHLMAAAMRDSRAKPQQSPFNGRPPQHSGHALQDYQMSPIKGRPRQRSRHALQDYQMQLMLLEQEKKNRLLMERQEQGELATYHGTLQARDANGFFEWNTEVDDPNRLRVAKHFDDSTKWFSAGLVDMGPLIDLPEGDNGAGTKRDDHKHPVAETPASSELVSTPTETYSHAHQPPLQDPRGYTRLEKELQRLQAENSCLKAAQCKTKPETKWPVFYKVICPDSKSPTIYEDVPFLVTNSVVHNHKHYHGLYPIDVSGRWQQQNRHVTFVVYVHYRCCERRGQLQDRNPRADDDYEESDSVSGNVTEESDSDLGEESRHQQQTGRDFVREEVHIFHDSLRASLVSASKAIPGLQSYLGREFDYGASLRSPYLLVYHFEEELRKVAFTLRGYNQDLIDLLDYMSVFMQKESISARARLESGKVDLETVMYLFKPRCLLLHTEGEHRLVFQLLEAPIQDQKKVRETASQSERVSSAKHLRTHKGLSATKIAQNSDKNLWTLSVQHVEFDGAFRIYKKPINFELPGRSDVAVDITSLPVYPLQYAPVEVQQELASRGRKFYSCRNGLYVTGNTSSDNILSDNFRYMVDVQAYEMLHSSLVMANKSQDLRNKPGNNGNSLHDESLVIQLPPQINAFRIEEKKWVKLEVATIEPVKWDHRAFESLAIDSESKELIEALITNKIAADKATDMIQGKGNGLIVLLHGPPGTGKTLTAEGVAEIAQKPLYRVTCGDLGTDPVRVEKYLESVFALGKRWDCVVLLDEADVFLEQRSLMNLERNALVSVFLRVLEYYDGIMILTSNRVGTFDETFKSRIQLALRYETLNTGQRKQIWNNFVARLTHLDEPMDLEDITQHVDDLARHEINGRQIRNVITTARQLARFKNARVNFAHLEHVIRVSQRFEDYITKEVNEGASDSVLARENMIR